MTIEILLYSLVGGIVILAAWVGYLEHRLSKVFKGATGTDLESLLASIQDNIAEIEKAQRRMQEHMISVERRLKRSVQHVHTVRFNPFEDAGSNQSFATALLNEHGDGTVISTLYARERVNVFAKPVKNRESEYNLSEEEKQAIAGE